MNTVDRSKSRRSTTTTSASRHSRGPARSQRGQASIMMGMMMLTFILLFAFVVNTGMLVNAKINLQNAADLAAYAGASVQARQLTQISYLNYEMRRQYKKFLFRYYVIGNMAQKSVYASNSGPRIWSPDGDPKNDFGVPTVCIIFNPNDNFCQLQALKGIKMPPSSLLDTVNEVLRQQLKTIQDIKDRNCAAIGMANTQILFYWLWNTDPDLQFLKQNLDDPESKRILDLTQTLTAGIGLIPREMILKKRIETLQEYVNFPGQKELTIEKINALQSEGDLAARERTLQAFLSAYHTLGNNTFPADQIRMDELLADPLLRLEPITVGFDAYSTQFELRPNASDTRDCVAQAVVTTIPGNIPVGVYKDPKYLTYYTLRLQAKAKLLFSPFGDMTLKAYAAAQPFGSRIGPQLNPATDLLRAASNNVACPVVGLKCANQVPNLPLQQADSASAGWNQNEVIQAMFARLQSEGTPVGNNGEFRLTSAALERAYQAAMIPNPWEQGKYNIINDLSNDPFVRNFDGDRFHAFWAPLISKDKLGQGSKVEDEIQSLIDTVTAPANANNQTPDLFSEKFKAALKSGFSSYIAKLRLGQGEDGEGFNMVRLVDPFHTRPSSGVPSKPLTLSPPTLVMNQPELVRSSWNAVGDGNFQKEGRTGYSVKFVSFNTLMNQQGVTSNGLETWRNTPQTDADADLDLPFIQH